ncbi:MAG TPA: hypothetical protein VGQ03_10955 [Nitrososphaera sp.]|nr:hypothetical protein [Nitrososphaera sp.]
MELKGSKRIWVTGISIGVAAAVLTTLISWNLFALAGPNFVSGKLIATRVGESAGTMQDPATSAQFTSVNSSLVESNPKLKTALAGADERYEVLSKAKGYIVPMMGGEDVELTEEEVVKLVLALPISDVAQEVQGDLIGQYHYAHIFWDGKYYNIAITTVGSQEPVSTG